MVKKLLPQNDRSSPIERVKYLLGLIIYADIYNCAIREVDLVDFWGIAKEDIKLASGKNFVGKKDGYIFLKGHERIVMRTQKAREIAESKKKDAVKLLRFLIQLPWVKMVALSGSIGAMNANNEDDYDVFLVVEKNRKWLVRMFEYLYYGFVKRNRAFNNNPHRSNKICANVYIEYSNLELPISKRNLFVAYQCLLIQPIYGTSVYMQFLQKNRWIKNYFGQFELHDVMTESDLDTAIIKRLVFLPLDFTNGILGLVQRFKILMSGGRLNEIDYPGLLMFHPKDPSSKVVAEFEKKKDKFFKAARLDR